MTSPPAPGSSRGLPRFEPEEEVEIYSHFEDRQAAKSLFVGIGRYRSDAGEGYLLLEWKLAGYVGTYANWKREFLARRDASLREP